MHQSYTVTSLWFQQTVYLLLSLSLNLPPDPVKIKTGMTMAAMVTGTRPERGVALQLSQGYRGSTHLTQLADTYTDNPVSAFKAGQFVCCAVLSCKEKTKCILSLRKSRLVTFDAWQLLCLVSEAQTDHGVCKFYNPSNPFIYLASVTDWCQFDP